MNKCIHKFIVDKYNGSNICFLCGLCRRDYNPLESSKQNQIHQSTTSQKNCEKNNCHHKFIDDINTGSNVCYICGLVGISLNIFHFSEQCDLVQETNFNIKHTSQYEKNINDIKNVCERVNIKDDALIIAISIFKENYNLFQKKRYLACACIYFGLNDRNYILTAELYEKINQNFNNSAGSDEIKQILIILGKKYKPLEIVQISNFDKYGKFYERYIDFFINFKQKYNKIDSKIFENVINDALIRNEDIMFGDKKMDTIFAISFLLNKDVKLCKNGTI
jgi:hypothetical protein